MNYESFKSRRVSCLVTLVAIWLASLPVQAQSGDMPPMHMQQGAAATKNMKQMMTTEMESMQKMQMSGDGDKDFATMMKMHHQQGVEMAQMELAHGKSPAMRAMAKHIVAAQNKEIMQLEQWLAKQK